MTNLNLKQTMAMTMIFLAQVISSTSYASMNTFDVSGGPGVQGSKGWDGMVGPNGNNAYCPKTNGENAGKGSDAGNGTSGSPGQNGGHVELEVKFVNNTQSGVLVDVTGKYWMPEDPNYVHPVPATRMELTQESPLVVLANGGSGGDGGDGGNGGPGGRGGTGIICQVFFGQGGQGGDGGKGGDSGDGRSGGNGGYVKIVASQPVAQYIHVYANGGRGGSSGRTGMPGAGGVGGKGAVPQIDGKNGQPGASGRSGNYGTPGNPGTVILESSQ